MRYDIIKKERGGDIMRIRKVRIMIGRPSNAGFFQEVVVAGPKSVADVIRDLHRVYYRSVEKYHLDLVEIGGQRKGPGEVFRFRIACRGRSQVMESDDPVSLMIPSADCSVYIFTAPVPSE